MTGADGCRAPCGAEAPEVVHTRYHLYRAGPFEIVAIPEAESRRGDYAAAVVAGADHPETAGWLVDHLCGTAGRAVYARHGFTAPPIAQPDPTRPRGRSEAPWV